MIGRRYNFRARWLENALAAHPSSCFSAFLSSSPKPQSRCQGDAFGAPGRKETGPNRPHRSLGRERLEYPGAS